MFYVEPSTLKGHMQLVPAVSLAEGITESTFVKDQSAIDRVDSQLEAPYSADTVMAL